MSLAAVAMASAERLHAQFVWDGSTTITFGAAVGGNILASGATLSITSNSDHDFSGAALVNNGTVNWSGGRLRSGNGGTFTNNGTFNDSASNDWNNDYGNAALVFTNASGATYNKTASGTTTFVNPVAFNNSGTVNVTGGRLTLNGGGTSSGAFNVSGPGVELVINNGYALTSGASLSGAVRATAGTFTATGNISVNGFLFEGGTLAGTQTFVGGPLTWSNGTWNSSGTTTIASDATLNLATTADHDFSGHAIVNNGIVNWQAGRLRSGNGGTFTNNATFNDAASNVWNNDYGNAVLVFTNASSATYNKTASGTTRFDVPFNNSGTVALTAGTFQLNGGGTLAASGVINAASGTSVIFSNSYTLANASSLTGTGAFSLTAGTLTATGTINVSNFAITGSGTLAGTQTFAGGMSWTGGNLNTGGTTTIGSGTTFDIAPSGGAFDHDFSARAIVNNGIINWQAGAGRLRSGNGGSVTNNGTFNDASSFAMNNDYGNATLVFTNSAGATYNKTTGASRFDVPFNNNGTIAVSAGTLQFNGGGTNSATGTLSVASGATVLFSNSYTIADGSQLSGAGLYQATGGTFTVNGNVGISNFQFSNGTLAGTHTLNGTTTWNGGNLNSGGTTTIASGATFNLSPSGASAFDHDFSARALVNNGTVNWQANAGRLRSGNAGTITNNGTWNDAASNVVNNDYGNAVLTFANGTTGTYNKTAAGTTRFDVPFNNSGAVSVTSGTLQLNGGGTNSATGNITAATGTNVIFSDSYTLANASALSGAGAFSLTGGTLTATGNVNVSNFAVAGGTLAGTHTFTGGLGWTGGNFNSGGTTTIAAGSTFTIGPNGGSAFDHDFSARAIVNNGTTTWQANAGRLRSGNGGSFTNNGLFLDVASNAINNDYGNATLVFTNSAGATYRKTAAGTTTFQVPLANSGTLDIQAGTLALTADSTFNGGTTQIGAGLLQLAAGLLTANGNMTFSNFQMTGGTITGTHTFNGNVEWTSGNFNSGSSTTTLAGTTAIDGAADHDFSAHVFVNTGTVNWIAGAGRLRSGNGGTFSNQGIFNDAASNVWNNDYGNALAAFSNSATGIYNKTAAGTTTVSIAFNNGGTINAQAGSLDLNAGGSSPAGAAFNVSNGAALRFTGGSFALADGAGFSGTGTAAIAGATVSIGGNVAAPVFALTGGTLAGTQSFLGNVTWSGGNMNASGTTTIAAGASLTINSGADHDFSAHAIVNQGTVNWQVGRLRSGNGGSFTNHGVFNDSSGSTVNNDYGNATLAFTNSAAGTYNKNGANTTTYEVPFNNSGTVNVAAGSALSLTAGGTIGSGASYTGTGQAFLSGGTFTASGTLTSTSLVLAGATLAGTQSLAGSVLWNNGNFNSASTTTIAPGGTLNIATGSDHDFSAHAFVNNGTVNWQSGRLRSGNGGTFTNNGLFNDTASNIVNNDYGNTVLSFTNASGGIYNKRGAGTTTFQVPFTNSGSLLVSAGTLSFTSTFTNSGGSLLVAGGALSFSGPLNVGTSLLGGTGTITASTVIAGGIVSPGNSPGTLTIAGNLTLLSTSTLIIELGGTTQGAGYDFLNITGLATLDGSLQLKLVNSFAASASVNDTFTVLASGSHTGIFTNVPATGARLSTIDGTGSFLVNYSGNSVVLSQFVSIPEPSTYALLALGAGVLIVFGRRQVKRGPARR